MSKLFWKDAGERVVFTVAEVLLPFVAVDGFDIFSVNWKHAFSIIVGAGTAAFLKSVLATRKGGTVSPASLVSASSDVM